MTTQLIPEVIRVLQWIHQLERGEFIEAPGWTKTYMDPRRDGPILQKELELLVHVVNLILLLVTKSRFRVAESMGEIRPARANYNPQRDLL